ncbi:hypothetical protein [Dechloromonas sp. CZR5]|uniref:hypothetical protein n=1 Tax=Dechloromonas sp. CZR5 TaxID=2608630 RepID=UPI00123D4E02|nr:hypothetical protein [Dechloromonas sp. CZR5]
MMTHTRKLKHSDKVLIAAKRERQEKSRVLVESGERSQESMFFIAPSIARAAKVRHRVLSFG